MVILLDLFKHSPAYFSIHLKTKKDALFRHLLQIPWPQKFCLIRCILLINKKLVAKKNWTSADLQHLSSMVVATVQISNFFLSDLRLIADLDL